MHSLYICTMNIGEHIKDIRTSKGLTQSELSEKSGVAVRTIQRIENGEVTPSIYSLNAIGAALGVNLNETSASEKNDKFEFKIIISNFQNLFVDSKALIKRNWKPLLLISVVTLGLLFFNDLKSLFLSTSDTSTISVTTINCGGESECDMELVKKDFHDTVLWKRIIGGTSYDKAGDVVRTQDGSFIVLGSTSSFGKGNYDVLVAKVGSDGEIIWQKTYGEFLNDYGLKITAIEDNLYQIEGTKQICKTVNVSNDCYDQEWLFTIDENGFVK